MDHVEIMIDRIFNCSDEPEFNRSAIEVFQFQYNNNAIYRHYCELLHTNAEAISHYRQIPFLPVGFFRSHEIKSTVKETGIIFSSSGTTGESQSLHYITDVSVYEQSFSKSFRRFYGDISDYCVLALLPSYLERTGSSLVFMAEKLIASSGHPDSGFYLYDFGKLYEKLIRLKQSHQKTILLGVTYALLDFASEFPLDFPDLIVMETGGMKGRRREMIREEVHELLCKGFGLKQIHSEYGMTELLSQAYSSGNGIYKTPPWMKVLIRDSNDPLSLVGDNITGGINVIDLANLYSCAFIAVQDLGKTSPDGTFEVLGRFDQSQMRGCNLMVG
jgi:phenylacetate-coenzyme A ligase PaaK-like adenylate-forming protein